ncbi:MAG: ABC transporter ATP-binding protein [Gemmatimonadota bacterium]|nr:ABC transporter ATP-binding protein [Gemmatimonadota bacterium]
MEHTLALVDIVKRFGSISALGGASFSVRPGTVHALLGENGAGKTTLMRIAFGLVRPDTGRLIVHGRAVSWRSPADAIAAGIGMVHQHFMLVPAMTVAENVELGAGVAGRWRFERRRAEQRARALGRASGLEVDPEARVAELSVAAQQRVEILKALGRDARILILDEPTAVLAPRETGDLLRWLRTYADGGGTAILITHKLREAMAVADDVTVLRRGRTVLAARRTEADATSEAKALTRAMIGDESDPATRSVESQRSSAPFAPFAPSAGLPVVVLDDVTASDSDRRETVRATCALHAGEVVGVAGVEGAGQHTLLRVLAGRVQPTSGRLTRPAQGQIGFIPEDRQQEGLVLDFSLAENVALRGAGERRGRMAWSAIHRRTAELVNEYDVRASGVATAVRTLSGGNQQRLVLARELDGQPVLVVAENPTRGLDVRATADVLDRLREARDAGVAVVLYSSDLDEVLALATRVLAVHAGTVREVAPQKDLVGRAILGLP